jgi:hypothetical protein
LGRVVSQMPNSSEPIPANKHNVVFDSERALQDHLRASPKKKVRSLHPTETDIEKPRAQVSAP